MKNALTSKRSVSLVEGPILTARRFARAAGRIFAVAIILWLGIRCVRSMADRTLRGIITGGVR